MKTLSLKTDLSKLSDAVAQCMAISPDLVMIFGPSGHFGDSAFRDVLRPLNGSVMGCSTAGEIAGDGVHDNSISLLAMKFAETPVRIASAQLDSAASSYKAGVDLAAQLNGPGLRNVFVLSPGTNVNGSELVRGLKESLPPGTLVTGGLAGDGDAFQKTWTLSGEHASQTQVIAFALYGDRVSIGYGSEGGWKPYGPARRVTKSASNVLYEIDNKPALMLYKNYLGDKAAQLPASGLFYPFGILYGDDNRHIELIRTILDVDHKAESLTLAGDMPEGARVCLMHADTDSLIDGARNAAMHACSNAAKGDAALLMVSCVGRKLLMGADIDEEVEAVLDVAAPGIAVGGFYSYGEIAPLGDTGCALHNETMTLTHITETAG